MSAVSKKPKRNSAGSSGGTLHQSSLFKFTKLRKQDFGSSKAASRFSPGESSRQKENVAPSESQEDAGSSPLRGKGNSFRIISSRNNAKSAAAAEGARKRKGRDWEEVLCETASPTLKKRCVVFSHSTLSNSPVKVSAIDRHASFDFDVPLPTALATPTHSFQPLFDDVIPGSDPLEQVESSQTQYLTPPRSSHLQGSPKPSQPDALDHLSKVVDDEEDAKSPRRDDSAIIPSSQPEPQMLGEDMLSPVKPKTTPKPRSPVKLVRRVAQPLTGLSSGRDTEGIQYSGSPQTKMVQRVRRQGRSLPNIDPSKSTIEIEPFAARRTSSASSSENPVDHASTVGNRAKVEQEQEQDPFWETQPLLAFTDFSPLSSPSPSSRNANTVPLVPRVETNAEKVVQEKEEDSSVTEDSSPLRPDPDQTLVHTTGRKPLLSKFFAPTPSASKAPQARTPTQGHTNSTGRTLVRNSSSFSEADKTMVNNPSTGIVKRSDLQDIMRAVRGLSSLSSRKRTVLKPLHDVIDLAASEEDEEEEEKSPSKRIKNSRITEPKPSEVTPAETSPALRTNNPTHGQGLGLMESREEEECDRPFSPVQIDSQLEEEESIPIMSLPANWTALELETPPKSERRSKYSPASCSQAPKMRDVLDSPPPTSVEEYGYDDDDEEDEPFGPPLSPGSRTVENGWPEVLVRFENQPDPYPGMFDGNSVCGSDDDI